MKHKYEKKPRKKRGKIRFIIAGILALAGLCVLLYPVMERTIYEREVASEKDAFLAQVKEASEKQAQIDGQGQSQGQQGDTGPNSMPFPDLYAFMQAENVRMYEMGQSDLMDAFSYEQPMVDMSKYGIYGDRIGFITIPSIGVELPISLGANPYNLGQGTAHLTQTSYPIGGINTNCVIAGHRGRVVPMLRNIDKIAMGDEIYITNPWGTLVYKAVEVKIVHPYEIENIKIQEGRDLVTLFACHPFLVNTDRYVLYCERVR